MPYNNTPIAPPAEVTGNVALPRKSSVFSPALCYSLHNSYHQTDLRSCKIDYHGPIFPLYTHY
jgi:hypothetical protein